MNIIPNENIMVMNMPNILNNTHSNININIYKCMARQKTNPEKQCRGYKKVGDYCQRCHNRWLKENKINRIDEPYETIIKSRKVRTEPVVLQWSSMKNMSVHKLRAMDIKITLNHHKIFYEKKHKKLDLYLILKKYFQTIEYYTTNIHKLIFIQKLYKQKYKKLLEELQGPVYLDMTLIDKCVNEEDLFTCEPIKDIPKKYLFSYRDDRKFLYAFDARSFKKGLEFSKLNPYSQKDIPDSVIHKFNLYYSKIEKYVEDIKDEEEMTPEMQFEQWVLSICQKYDKAGYYMDVNWILNLNGGKLKMFYRDAMDIWSYRCQLPTSIKQKIVENGVAFNIPLYTINSMDIYQIRKEVVREMERFIDGPSYVSPEDNKDNKVLGIIYILTALVGVSQGAFQAYPHLYQENEPY